MSTVQMVKGLFKKVLGPGSAFSKFMTKANASTVKSNLSQGVKRKFDMSQSFYRVSKPNVANHISRTVTGASLAVGATAMLATSMMRGMFSQANTLMDQKMGRDMRYSMATQATMTNVGRRAKTMNVGNHTGLALAMYKRRHG